MVVKSFCRFFFNDTATTEIYTLSLHDALPISIVSRRQTVVFVWSSFGPYHVARCRAVATASDLVVLGVEVGAKTSTYADRKSTRLNSSHANISYAVFCLKKKHNIISHTLPPAC